MEILSRSHANASEVFGQKEANVNETLNEVPKGTTLTINVSHTVQEYKTQRVQAIAKKLADDLDAQKDYQFFCKCAWKLPESIIWAVEEAALRPAVKSPVRYFTAVAAHELRCR